MKPELSESQENYLKLIFQLSEPLEPHEMVSALDMAGHLEVKPASVTNMLKRLAGLKLIDYKPYYGARLTASGEMVALEILRHHRLLELYLSEVLGFGWEEVHEEAERLEHVISEQLEAKIAEKLGHPTHDPHGDPIPSAELELPESTPRRRLTSLAGGTQCRIARVTAQDSDTLNMLSRLNLVLKAELYIINQQHSGVRLEVQQDRFLLPAELASKIWVEV
ncbi:MAG: metal-dependent transcriptional regulator [Cyclonatronaceae bacterium]